MNHTKDCMKPINMADFAQRVCMRTGSVTEAEHRALRSIEPSPYESLAWTTALAIVRERMAVAQERAADMSVFPADYDSRAYAEGRYHALRDCLEEMEERGKS
jgi:hypothetical protein